ncbi:uncharacterized protein MELLADRAFT_85864 [Melampsora larici-populina 98AG31]|uniref:Uncharacterized protein n=1 Tax=Melampsora larici-populina (strain 98AG31 / pathotype 3-4-7) TaxID=747676 RepID=F4SDF0_MELLP|nr:uncharacterized protein MELLADRAFT_85864 [Melampsora larici-populina 98AG31]EGF97326.1 hypothetical protein MELLADRAFT_85864 [Melampsora larici-populina 98AG31]
MSLRSGRQLSPSAATAPVISKQRRDSANTKKKSLRKNNRGRQPTPEPDATNLADNIRSEVDTTNLADNTRSKEFTSSFPSLNIDNMEQELDKWTVVDLRKELAERKKNASRHKNQVPTEINNLVQLIRLDHEKRMLMAALIGGISETMVWELTNVGPTSGKSSCWTRFLSFGKKPLAIEMPHRNNKAGWAKRNTDIRDIWDNMTNDEKMVFRTPYFFALAKLPDLSSPSVAVEVGDVDQEINEEDISAQVTSPHVNQLSEEEELLYRPIFDELVDVEKVHFNHGKPEKNVSVASLQLKSLAAFRVAHHNFAIVCQRFHIHYYLTALSCDISDGWNEVYSTNKTFSEWADEKMEFSTKFKYYVHGKVVASEIEKKAAPPVDARRAELTKALNHLMQTRSRRCHQSSRMAYSPGTNSTR